MVAIRAPARFKRVKGYYMSDIKSTHLTADAPVTKQPWQTPDFETLSVRETANNGLVAPGDATFSPSPTGS